ncbi:class I SAM-dependent methyltransferase [Haliea salexigens]|uniref:class I SAM-dependent methyltransferase n=1 Tax=Haliea salexigens TaxID=287487 RepID=UPI003B845796
MKIVGSDVDNFECPNCGAHDRERHLFLYLNAADLFTKFCGKDILHFAPERHLSARIAECSPNTYVKADLYPYTTDIVPLDLLDLPYPNCSFDFLVANHVLEHVGDDLRALSEICRVLRVGGAAILQTPFSERLNITWQDDGIDSASARLIVYGQEDHLRLYGNDIIKRFSSVGLSPLVATHVGLLPSVNASMFGVNPHEPFFLFERRE